MMSWKSIGAYWPHLLIVITFAAKVRAPICVPGVRPGHRCLQVSRRSSPVFAMPAFRYVNQVAAVKACAEQKLAGIGSGRERFVRSLFKHEVFPTSVSKGPLLSGWVQSGDSACIFGWP